MQVRVRERWPPCTPLKFQGAWLVRASEAVHGAVGVALSLVLSSPGRQQRQEVLRVGAGVAPELGLPCKMEHQ